MQHKIASQRAGAWMMVPAVLLVWTAAQAQQPPAPPAPALRSAATISAIDKQSIQQWVDATMDALFTRRDLDTEDPKFLSQILEQYNASGASPAFKQELARSVIDALGKRYAGKTSLTDTNLPQPLAVVHAMLALKEFNDPAAFDIDMKALVDTSAAGVRLLAAESLIAMKTKLKTEEWGRVVAAVQAAGVAEQDPYVLARYYRLLTLDNNPAAADAMFKIIDARLGRFEQNGEIPAAADRVAAEWMGPRGLAVKGAAQNAITQRLARMLTDAVYAFMNLQSLPQKREQMERVILASEQQLRAIVTPQAGGKPLPDVSKAMLDSGANQVKNMLTELDKWIGGAGTPGVLNGNPFNMPAGLNIKRPTPTTSAPAASKPE